MGNNGKVKLGHVPKIIKYQSRSKFEKWFTSHKKLSMGMGLVCTALLSASLAAVAPEKKQESEERTIIEERIKEDVKNKEEPKEVKKGASLEEVLSRHCSIEEVVNPDGTGNIYLVGTQINAYIRNKKDQVVLIKDDATANVQADIYHLLRDLVEERDLKLVMGPEIGSKELVGFGYKKYGNLTYDLKRGIEDKENAIQLFRERKYLSAHIVFELLYKNKVRTFGFDDREEVKRQNKLYEKLVEKHFEYKKQKDPKERELLSHLAVSLVAELDVSRRVLSRVRMRDGVRRINVENEKDVCMISGAHNVTQMAEIYKSMIDEGVKRRLYLLRPKSISKKAFFAAKDY